MSFVTPEKSNRSNLKYAFNWLAAMIDYLPIIMRRVKIVSFISVPILYIWNLYESFLLYRSTLLFVTAANGQTIVLEKMLKVLFNDEIMIVNIASFFDTQIRYRRGEEPALGDETYIYRRGESIPISGNQEYNFRKEEVQLNVDFLVKIPNAVISSLNLSNVAAIIDFYKMAGTTYKIQGY